MKFSQLYDQYGAMLNPTYCLKVDGAGLELGEDVRLRLIECELTSRRRAGVLRVEAELTADGEQSGAWLDAFQLGAVCSLALGYDGENEDVFVGRVYELDWGDPLDGVRYELQAVCLDARGQLMLSSCADAGGVRTVSQMVEAILGQAGCKQLAGNQTIEPVPEDWDCLAQRMGETDYEVLCRTADFLGFELSVFADSLYFGPPKPESDPTVEFDGPNGLMRLRRRRTLAGQCAAVAVSGADDKGERLYARQARKTDSGFGVDKMANALDSDLHQPVSGMRTMAQAQYLAKARMEERERGSGALLGQGTGLPELRPGRFVKVSGLSEPLNGSYYVHTVRHTLDETGFETSFEAED